MGLQAAALTHVNSAMQKSLIVRDTNKSEHLDPKLCSFSIYQYRRGFILGNFWAII